MPRLPKPGGDDGTWGQVLNDFLSVEHQSDGKLNPSGSLSQKYTMPSDGIPKADLHTSVQTSLDKIDPIKTKVDAIEALQDSNGKFTRAALAPDVAATLSLVPTSYGATGDGATDDTVALQALLDAGAGKSIFIDKPNAYYRISGPLAIHPGTNVILHPQAIIEQVTKNKPVFDLINADNVVMQGNGSSLRYTGSRTYQAGPAYRGDEAYGYGAGVWSNGNHNRIQGFAISGFTVGVYLSAWNGSTLADYAKTGNEVSDIVIDNNDWGVLLGGQVSPVISRIRGSYSIQPGSGNPSHLIYVTKTGKNRAVNVNQCSAINGTGGAAYQFKGIDGGSASGLIAHGCEGLLSLDADNDFSVEARAIADRGQGENGSLGFVNNTPVRCIVNVSIAAADDTMGYRLASIDGQDNMVRIMARSRQTTTTENYYIILQGVRNTIDLDVINVEADGSDLTTGRRGVSVFSGSDHTVILRQARNVRTSVDVTAGVTGTQVEISPRVVPIPTALTPLANLSIDDARLVRSAGLKASISGPGQTVRADATRFITTSINVTTADAFSVGAPYGVVPRGTRLAYVISNTSGGATGTVTWSGHSLTTAWSSPATGLDKTIEFSWDGTRWKEIGRTT